MRTSTLQASTKFVGWVFHRLISTATAYTSLNKLLRLPPTPIFHGTRKEMPDPPTCPSVPIRSGYRWGRTPMFVTRLMELSDNQGCALSDNGMLTEIDG